jgi:Double-stranded DNA-binding domain
MLSQLLDQQARARLNTLKISKPEKAEIVNKSPGASDGLLTYESYFVLGGNELD